MPSAKDKAKAFIKHPGVHAVVVVLTGAWLVDLLDLAEKIPDWTLAFLRLVVNKDQLGAVHLELSTTGKIIVDSIYGGVIVAVSSGVFFGSRFLQSLREGIERTFGGYYLKQADALYRFVHQSREKLCYADVERRFLVKSDYSVLMVDTLTVRAKDVPVYALGWEGQSDAESRGFSSIGFDVKILSGEGRILTVPATDRPKKKRALILFVPAIAVGAVGMRLELRSQWRNAGRTLETPNSSDTYVYNVAGRVGAPIDNVKLIFETELPGEFAFEEDWDGDYGAVGSRDVTPRRYEVLLHGVAQGVKFGIDVVRKSNGSVEVKK